MEENVAPRYRVWGADNIAYGPVELLTLVSWIKLERVLADTWIFTDKTNTWTRATDLAELKALFREKPAGGGSTTAIAHQVTLGALRRVKMFAAADEKTLESLLRYMEPVEVPAFAVLVHQGEPADAMYFLLSGEVRAYVLIDGKESTLATILPGEEFGEIALLDHGPRSAFVAANQPSLLLKMTASGFEQIMREAPALAMPFVLGLARALAARFRGISKRYQDSIHFSRMAGVG